MAERVSQAAVEVVATQDDKALLVSQVAGEVVATWDAHPLLVSQVAIEIVYVEAPVVPTEGEVPPFMTVYGVI